MNEPEDTMVYSKTSDELRIAIKNNDTTKALQLFNQGFVPNENVTNPDDEHHSMKSSLHYAAFYGNEPIVSAILNKTNMKEFLSEQNRPTASPLHYAAMKGHLEVCWLLLLASFSLDSTDERLNTPLHYAASNGQESVCTCFINHGAQLDKQNCFRFNAFDTASTEAVRQILRQAMVEEGHLDNEERAKKGKDQMDLYMKMRNDLTVLIAGYEIQDLEKAIEGAKDFGMADSIIQLGRHRLKWLEVRADMLTKIDNVKEHSPITTQDHYKDSVEPLLSTIESVEEMIGTDPQSPDEVKELVTKAVLLCAISKTELSLKKAMEQFDSIECASSSNVNELNALVKAIEDSKTISADMNLQEQAETMLAKLKAELNLQEAIENLPNVRIPIPDMTPKEAKEYYTSDDYGMIKETEEFPLLPQDSVEYIWIKSKSLTSLEEASTLLQDRINDAKEHNGNEDLISKGIECHETKTAELALLLEKNEIDRAAAVKNAQKAAKKLRKKRKKKVDQS